METRDANIPSELSGLRLDKASASLFPEFSRNQLKHWIEDGNLQLNGAGKRPRDKVSEGDHLTLSVVLEEQVPCEPEDLPLEIIYQDESLTISINRRVWWYIRVPEIVREPCKMRCCSMIPRQSIYRVPASCIAWTRRPVA